ncbi:SDR family oxidoreductase [Candidatus Woesearchaeota archaeon]|nr:SDR family oxidoreductase [Candidatus Woesearchaeota archaeon]
MELEGKRALVTGGSKGIGRDLLIRLASEGVELLTVARSEDLLKTLKEEVQNKGGKLEYRVMDLSEESSINKLIDWVYETGGAEILILNAGYLPESLPFESKFSEFNRAFFLNTTVPIYLAERWIKSYYERKDSSLRKPEYTLLVSSISGLISYDDVSTAYTGSKTAVSAAYQNLRMAAAEKGWNTKFAVIYPSTIDTEMTKDKPWERMTLDVVVDSIISMIKEQQPYGKSTEVVLDIKEDGVYAGMMPISSETNRPNKDMAKWLKIAGNDKIIRV